MPRRNDACDANYIPSIADKVMKDYPFERMKNLLKLENYREWNAEGFGYLDKNVYSVDLKRGELPSKFYQAPAFALGERQTALAGYRIGETLNNLFCKSDNNDSSNKLK